MRRIGWALVAVIVIGWSVPTEMWGADGWSGWGKVMEIMVAGPYIIIDHENPGSPCGDYANGVHYPEYIIDTRTQEGQMVHTLAVAALVAQYHVRIWSVDKETHDPHCYIRYFQVSK